MSQQEMQQQEEEGRIDVDDILQSCSFLKRGREDEVKKDKGVKKEKKGCSKQRGPWNMPFPDLSLFYQIKAYMRTKLGASPLQEFICQLP